MTHLGSHKASIRSIGHLDVNLLLLLLLHLGMSPGGEFLGHLENSLDGISEVLLDRFQTGLLIDEHGAAGVAH